MLNYANWTSDIAIFITTIYLSLESALAHGSQFPSRIFQVIYTDPPLARESQLQIRVESEIKMEKYIYVLILTQMDGIICRLSKKRYNNIFSLRLGCLTYHIHPRFSPYEKFNCRENEMKEFCRLENAIYVREFVC